jgi:hypothetical protein
VSGCPIPKKRKSKAGAMNNSGALFCQENKQLLLDRDLLEQ